MSTDSCPECSHPWNPPQLVIPVGDGTEETYRCGRCRHQRWTSWGPSRTDLDAQDWPETA